MTNGKRALFEPKGRNDKTDGFSVTYLARGQIEHHSNQTAFFVATLQLDLGVKI